MNICVYGGASADIDSSYIRAGEELGELMGKRGHDLVFGGGDDGMMGAVARGIKNGGGKILGVVPTFFNVDGILYERCDKMVRTETMRERKQIMEDNADAFITTPGGIGTFEEFFEILTLKQLGRHQKPMVVFDVNGYYDRMVNMINNAIEEDFMTPGSVDMFFVTSDPVKALEYIENYVPEEFDILKLRKIRSESEK